jgi:flagellar basal-body rod protein FlgF
METPGYIALARQGGLRREMDLIANNLANLNTPAYRGESMMFVDHLEDTEIGETGKMYFSRDVAVLRDLQEGPMEATGNPLDLAISGEGYFVVETPEGARYTRNGSFQLNQDNELVTHAGQPVLDDNGNAIEIPFDAQVIDVSSDGVVSTEAGEVAVLDLVSFENEQALLKRAGGLYDAGEEIVLDAEDAQISQGMLEGSNVESILEMVRMMSVAQSHGSAQQMGESEHERRLRAVRSLISSGS